MREGIVVHNPTETYIVLSLIPSAPGRTSEGFSPDEDQDKSSGSNTMSVLPGSPLCRVIPKLSDITETAYDGTVFERLHFIMLSRACRSRKCLAVPKAFGRE